MLVAFGVLQEHIITCPYFPLGRAPCAGKGARGRLRGREFFNRLMLKKWFGSGPHGNGGVVRGMVDEGDGEKGVESGQAGVDDGEGGGYGQALENADEYVLAGFVGKDVDGGGVNQGGDDVGGEGLCVPNTLDVSCEVEQEDGEDTGEEKEEQSEEGKALGLVAGDGTDGALFQPSLFLFLADCIFAVVITLVFIPFRREYCRDLPPVVPL